MSKEKQTISKGLDVSDQLQKTVRLILSENDKEEEQGNQLLAQMETREFWINYSDEVKKFIEDHNKVFFCYWNDELGEIHSVNTMYHDFKDSNLYDREEFYGETRTFGDYDDFVTLVDWIAVEEKQTEDNMTIVRLK